MIMLVGTGVTGVGVTGVGVTGALSVVSKSIEVGGIDGSSVGDDGSSLGNKFVSSIGKSSLSLFGDGVKIGGLGGGKFGSGSFIGAFPFECFLTFFSGDVDLGLTGEGRGWICLDGDWRSLTGDTSCERFW